MSIFLKGVEMPQNGMLCIDIFDDGRIAGHYDCTIKGAKAIPAADVREVVRGKWQKIGQLGVVVVCSVCGKSPDRKTNFCPNCGADMREES